MRPEIREAFWKSAGPSRGRACCEWALIAGMLLVLCAPALGKTMGWPVERDLDERRKLASFPQGASFPWKDFPRAVDLWWNDHFAFRTQIIPVDEWIRMDLLQAPGKRNVLGKEGHLFPLATVIDFLGGKARWPMMFSNWIRYLEGKRAWLEAYGVRYLFIVAPNKTSVEGHFLPDRVRGAKGKTFFEEWREQVGARWRGEACFLDLTDVLIRKERETGGTVFSRKRDVSHWNGMGFYEGLLAMDKHLRRDFPLLAPFPKDKAAIKELSSDPTSFIVEWKDDPLVHVQPDPIIAPRAWEGEGTNPKCSEILGGYGSLAFFSDSSWRYARSFFAVAGLKAFSPGVHTAFPYQWGRHRHAAYSSFEELKRVVREDRPSILVEAHTERMLQDINVPAEFDAAAGFVHGATAFLWDVQHAAAMRGSHNVSKITVEGNILEVQGDKSDPRLEATDLIKAANGFEWIFFADIDSVSRDQFQVFWSTGAKYAEKNSVAARLEPGRNIIFLRIPWRPKEVYRLRIDPGTRPGGFSVRKFEIRAVSDPFSALRKGTGMTAKSFAGKGGA